MPCYIAVAACYMSQIMCETDRVFLSSSLNPLCQLALVAHSSEHLLHTDLEACPASFLWAVKPNFILMFGNFWKFTVATNRNYASLGGGARIIRGYTSETHDLPAPSLTGSLSRLFFGYNPQYANVQGAGIILEEDTGVGECWCISGAVGHVAIQLSGTVFISHLSVDYAAPRLLSEEEIASAPQNMSIWILLPPSAIKQDPNFNMRPAKGFEFRADQDADFPSGSQFVHALEFQYDVRKPPTRQIFPFRFRTLSPTQTVIVEIKSNEGGATTCLYWLGIHGRRADHISLVS